MNFKDPLVTLYNKDCRNMAELPNESVQCCVTSPPYWGLRKYAGEQELIWGGKDCQHEWEKEIIRRDRGAAKGATARVGNQIREVSGVETKQGQFCSLCGAWCGAFGLEPSPELYVQHTVEILREIRRVLRGDGVVFWNCGDSYWGGGNNRGNNSPISTKQASNQGAVGQCSEHQKNIGKHPSIKPKDLCLIPFRVAIAAQADGWWVRSVIIWNKNNPMPESVKDRPTESHEYILMLTKSARYFWDMEAVREPQSIGTFERYGNNDSIPPKVKWAGMEGESNTAIQEHIEQKQGVMHAILPAGRNLRSVWTATDPFSFWQFLNHELGEESLDRLVLKYAEYQSQLKDVWTFATQPFKGAHFATFPEELVRRCVLAATPEMGCCSKCGAPWARVIEKGLTAHTGVTESAYPEGTTAKRLALLRQAARERGQEYTNETKTIGWRPTCSCGAPAMPSLILDPFAGSGTTLAVAKRLGRRAVGYEISEPYCRLAQKRIEAETAPLAVQEK